MLLGLLSVYIKFHNTMKIQVYGETEQCYSWHQYGGALWAQGSSRIITKKGEMLNKFRSRLDREQEISATLKNGTLVVQLLTSHHMPISYTLILTSNLFSLCQNSLQGKWNLWEMHRNSKWNISWLLTIKNTATLLYFETISISFRVTEIYKEIYS